MKFVKFLFILPLFFSLSKSSYGDIIKNNTAEEDQQTFRDGAKCVGCGGTAIL